MASSENRAAAVAAASIGAFAATLLWRLLTFTGFTNDHYAHLALAQQMLLGERPVRDFSDPGWPLTYSISAAAWRLAGDTMAIEWAVAAVAFALAAACTVIGAYRLSGSVSIAALVAVLEIVIFPRTYAYPKILPYAAGAVAMLALAARPSWHRIGVVAALIAIAFLLRHDHGLYIGAASALCLALASRTERFRVVAARLAGLTCATGLFLLPWILFVSLNGGLPAYFDTALEFARSEANASNLRTWPRFRLVQGQLLLGLAPPSRPLAQVEWTSETSDTERRALEQRYALEFVRTSGTSRFYYVHDTTEANLRALDDDPHAAGTTGLGGIRRSPLRELLASASPFRIAPALHSAENADAWLFWLFWTVPTLCGGIVLKRALARQERRAGELEVVTALVVLALFVDAGFLRDLLRTRLSDAIVPAALLAAWALGLCWIGRWRRQFAQRAIQLATIVAAIVSIGAISRVAEFPERFERTGLSDGVEAVRERFAQVSRLLRSRHRQDIAPPSYVSAALMPFFSYVDRCTSTTDRLIVTGEFPDVVVLAGRMFASDGVVMGAWYSSAIHQDRTLERMQLQPPLFVIYVDPAPFRARFPLIQSYIAREYEPLANLPSSSGDGIPILVQRNRKPTGTDPQTRWPCFT